MSTYHVAKAGYGVLLSEEQIEHYGIDDYDYTEDGYYVVVPYELGSSVYEVVKLFNDKFGKYNIDEEKDFHLYVWSY